jgi:excisionase family DNA binding protein
MDRLLTVKEASDLLRLNIFSVYEMARNGILPSVRFGRAIRFRPDALDAWTGAGGVASRSPAVEQQEHMGSQRKPRRRSSR